ncbi:UvrD-helicase domain-containing protein [Actinomyces oricola]
MPAIVWPASKVKDATSKDPSLRAKIGPFMAKLNTMGTSSGLHLEHIRGAADRRVRTARVTDSYRAVLFVLNAGTEPVYVIHGIWQHDDANKIAETVRVGVNPYNGTTEFSHVTDALRQDVVDVEQAQRDARKRLAAAKQEAEELAREAARIEAANERARRRVAGAAAPAAVAPGRGDRGEARSGAGAGAKSARSGPAAGVRVKYQDAPPTWPEGISIERLRDELGIDVGVAAAALAAKRESELLDLAVTMDPAWQGEALFALATGSSIEEIKKTFGLRAPQRTSATARDADVIAGLRTPAAQSMFTWVETDEDLRRAIEGLSFAQWQIFLHPQQRNLVERRVNGPMRIFGGAGTGKTVVTVHRAAALAERDAKNGQDVSVLLTTYTRNLADDLKRQLAELSPTLHLATKVGEPGVLVSGLDRVAWCILQSAGDSIAHIAAKVLGRKRTRLQASNTKKIWQEVLLTMEHRLPEHLRSVDFLESEYELVILPHRVTTLQTYLRVRRPGRGVPLNRKTRAAVWEAIETYRDKSASLDIISFSEQLALAAAWLERDAEQGLARPYKHVLTDEAQDLTPAHLQLLRALADEGPDDLFLAEDSHQRIYGKKITLSHYGIEVRGRSRRLTRNYRTTRQNLGFAFSILERGVYEDMEGQPEEHHYVSPRSGPDPMLIHATSRAHELDEAATLIGLWLEEDTDNGVEAPETIAILVRDRYQRDAVTTGLAERGIEVRSVDREAARNGRPVVMTMHRAKGLEFRKVLLFDVSESSIPRSLRDLQYSEADYADALLRERSLLYVAATRARDQLAISWSGDASPLLEGIAGM